MKIDHKRLFLTMLAKLILAILGILLFLLIGSWFGHSIVEANRQYQVGQQLIIIEQENDNHDHWNKDN